MLCNVSEVRNLPHRQKGDQKKTKKTTLLSGYIKSDLAATAEDKRHSKHELNFLVRVRETVWD